MALDSRHKYLLVLKFLRGRKGYPELTSPAAVQALKLVRFETERVCASSGIDPPEIRIVASLRNSHDDVTADMRALKHRRGYEMNVPLRVVESCPPAGLRWLVAHEVGHIASRSTSQEHFRHAALTTALLSALFCLGTTAPGAVADFSGTTDEWGFPRALSMGVLVLTLVWLSFLRRADERRADVFAAVYLGEVRGAKEYFSFTTNAHQRLSLAEKVFLVLLWPLRSHPSHPERLKLMGQHLPPAGMVGRCKP